MSRLSIQLTHISRLQALKSHHNIMFHAETRQSMTEIEICKAFHEAFEDIVETIVHNLRKVRTFLNDKIMNG